MLQKKWLYNLPYGLLSLVIICFLLTHSPNYLHYDAPSYIHFFAIRPPLYPIFVFLFRFTGTYQFTLIMWVQAILTFSALLYARYWLKNKLLISDFLIFLVFIAVIFTILFHFQLTLISSEGLSFPLFIMTFFLLIECFQELTLKNTVYLALWSSLLMLTRLQLYYFYVIFAILIIWHYWKKTPINKLSIASAVLITSIILTSLIDRTYHYFVHGSFSPAPATGKLLIVQPIFLNGNDPINYLKNDKEKMYAQEMLDKIHSQKLNTDAILLATNKLSSYQYAYEQYNRNYISLYNIISEALNKNSQIRSNNIAISITKQIFFHDYKKNIAFFLWKFIQFMGGIPLFLFFLILFAGVGIQFFINRTSNFSFAFFFVSMVILVTFLNAFTVALVEAYLPVYFCYSQFIFYCLAAFFADISFKNSLGTVLKSER